MSQYEIVIVRDKKSCNSGVSLIDTRFKLDGVRLLDKVPHKIITREHGLGLSSSSAQDRQ